MTPVCGVHRRLIPLTALSALTACVHPSAVARYAESASTAGEAFPPLARELYSSCTRFEALKAQRTDAWYDETSLRRACASRDTAVYALIMANKVLVAYLDALGNMARGTSPEKEVGQFVRLLVGKSGFDQAQTDAAERLANFVASRVGGGFRKSELSQVIASRNGDVQILTGALLRVLANDFRSAFDVEARAMENFFRTSLTEYAAREPLAAILVREQRDRRQSELETKRRGIASYETALRRIQSGHQKLFDERSHLNGAALARDLLRAANELDSIAREIERAFR